MGSYATVQDARDAGITETMIADASLADLLEEVSIQIDKFCQWWFDPRARTLTMDGSGTQTLELPVPPIEITKLSVDDEEYSLDPDDLFVRGAPVEAGGDFYDPYVQLKSPSTSGDYIRRGGCRRSLFGSTSCLQFPFGRSNVVIEGTWGYTEYDGTAQGRTPLGIKRAALMMANKLVTPIASTDPIAAQAWRVKSIKTFDQSVTFSEKFGGAVGEDGGEYTGDPAIDSILSQYARPFGIGATLGAYW